MKWNDSFYHEMNNLIISCMYKVHKKIGPGFLECIYHKALEMELLKCFEQVETEKQYEFLYENIEIGKYILDLVIDNKVLVEIKAVKELNDHHKSQIISQLRISNILIGFLVNFSKKDLVFKRYDNFYEIERLNLKL